MRREALLVCSVHSDFDGWRVAGGNAHRTLAARAAIDWAVARSADLVVFPAGYLRARAGTPESVREAGAEVLRLARRHRIAIVLGVDACAPEVRSPDVAIVARGKLPFFVLAWSPDEKSVAVWRQRSTTSRDARAVSDEASDDVRLLVVRGTNVGVVLSGEGFNAAIREAMVAAEPALAVMPAHVAGGLRHWQALGWLRDNGVPALRAVHAGDAAENVLWRGEGKESALEVESFESNEQRLEASLFAA
ncbi:hypothetical protein BH09MYX1_BH09MYX1_59880 [soil metagenome]